MSPIINIVYSEKKYLLKKNNLTKLPQPHADNVSDIMAGVKISSRDV